MSTGIRVTCEDLETGETQTQVIDDDYVLVTAGSYYLAGSQVYPNKGTAVLTIKRREERAAEQLQPVDGM